MPAYESFTHVPSRLDQLAFKATERLVYPLADLYWRLVRPPQAQAIVNQKEIRVIGMRRTGNHALLNWLQQQQPGKCRFLNNVAAGKNPYRHKADNLLRYHPEHRKMSEVYRRQARGNWEKCDCFIYSYEDWSLKQITQPRFELNRELYVGKSRQQCDVLILRDPFNLFASRFKQNFVATKAKQMSMVDMWLEYAREFVGESRYLQGNLICISYNRWFADIAYRRQIAEQLGFPFSDAGREQVCGIGGGSSFDGTALSGKASAMNVTNRWRQFADDPTFQALLKNEEIWHYSQQIFGDLSGTAALRS